MSSTVRYTTAPDPSSPPSQTSAQASTRKREAVELETGSSSGTRQAGVLDAAPTVSISDFKNIYKVPCARDAFLVGIGTGFAVGGVRLVAGSTAWKAMTWFYVSWAIGSVGMFQFCQRKRALEHKGMERATEIMERKKKEKDAEAKKLRDEILRIRAARIEEEERKERGEWWKDWLKPGDLRRRDDGRRGDQYKSITGFST